MKPLLPRLAAGLLAMVLSTPGLGAQSVPSGDKNAGAATFDVAVIRPHPVNPSGHEYSHIWSSASDGHFKAQNVTAMALIRYAFDVPEARIEGGPAWMRTKSFDTEARSLAAVDEAPG